MTPQSMARFERLEPRPLLLAGGGLLALLLIAAWFYLIRPPLGTWKELARQHQQSELSLAEQNTGSSTGELNGLETRVAALELVLQAGRGSASANEMMATIIGTLDRLADRHGVLLAGVRPGEPTEAASFEERPFDVEASGSYFALIAWLRSAEVELRPMLLKQFRFRRGDNGSVQVDLRVVSYRVPDDAS